jgi:hypothetical protein
VPSPLGERLMIPIKYLDELKTAPIDHVDFVATFIEVSSSEDRSWNLEDMSLT